MIKTIIFDLGKVIIPFDFRLAYDRMAGHCSLTAAQIPERLRTCDVVFRFESGKIGTAEFIAELSSVLGMQVDRDQFASIWTGIFARETLLPESLFESLRKRYRMLLLSNTNELHFEMVREAYPLLRHFDEFILSYKVGAMKPDAAMFEAALECARCLPGECFFTDDILSNVEAARAHGIDAVQFHDREQLEGEMRSRGIDF